MAITALTAEQISDLNDLFEHMPELGKGRGRPNPMLGDLFAQVDVAVDLSSLTATAAEINILDGATLSTAELNILDGVTATAAEINNAADDSLHTQAIVAPGAITVDGTVNRVTFTTAVNGAVTLAAPSAAMKGKVLTLEFIGAGTDATTLALTEVQGGSAATTASFNAANETLVLIGGELKWNVLKEVGVTLT